MDPNSYNINSSLKEKPACNCIFARYQLKIGYDNALYMQKVVWPPL